MTEHKKAKAAIEPAAIPCTLLPETRARILKFTEDLKAAAPKIGSHGLNEDEFWNSGLFQSAVERLRGTQAASTSVKRGFLEEVLAHMKTAKTIASFNFTGGGDRHDYQIEMPTGKRAVFEAKGCLDGNNTNIFQRPPNADEFFIWSLCQNAGADPRHNAWSGIHTRLGPAILAENGRVVHSSSGTCFAADWQGRVQSCSIPNAPRCLQAVGKFRRLAFICFHAANPMPAIIQSQMSGS